MINKLTYFLIIACLVTSDPTAVAFNQGIMTVRQANNRAKLARDALEKLLQRKDIPMEAIEQARAIAVFPTVAKSGTNPLNYKTKGQGLISRRTEIGWTAPAFFEISKSGSGIRAESTLVIVFAGDGEVNDLRQDKLTFDRDASTRPALGPKPSPVRSILAYEFANGISIDPIIEGATLKAKNDDNKAVYGLKAHDVLFLNKRLALNRLEAAPEAFAFTKSLNNVAPEIFTPKIGDFPDTSYDFKVYQSLEVLKTHIIDFLNSRNIKCKEEPADLGGVIITAYVDLTAKRKNRILRAAFLIRITPRQESNHVVKFFGFVQSQGDRENDWTPQPEDTLDYAKEYVDPIRMELKRLADSLKPKS